MEKTIKFNIYLNGEPIRKLDSLRNNFVVEDILNHFETGQLIKWLEVRGYEKEYEKVSSIDKNKDKYEIIKDLIEIFEVDEMEKDEIDGIINTVKYNDEEKIRNEKYKQMKYRVDVVINDYHQGYGELINNLIVNKDNIPIIKGDIQCLKKNYKKLFVLDNYTLYFKLASNGAWSVVFLMLKEEFVRTFWLNNDIIKNNLKENLMQTNNKYLVECLGYELKTNRSDIDKYNWTVMETANTKVLVLINKLAKVRTQDTNHDEYSSCNGILKILNGLEVKADYSNAEVAYLVL